VKATTVVFNIRLFAGVPERKALACFVRHYDADHLARHPKRKVSAMPLLMKAEMPLGETTIGYSFWLGRPQPAQRA
jgi:hypothetical protein